MQKHYLQDLIEPIVEAEGFELVRVLTIGQANPTLQVMIDTLDSKTDITVDDCAKVSAALSDMLDEKDPIADKYSLEVSSPGLDRPLTKPAHFARYVGYEIKLETEDKVENRKRFKGKLIHADNQNITLQMDDAEYVIPFALISKAKLVITDELWKEYMAAHEAATEN
jgi:ribosome maturation factor RimP